MNADEILADLEERLQDASNALFQLAQSFDEDRRLAKREGVLLALSYLREYTRHSYSA